MKLQSETLYILSGPPASGKSTFLKSIRMEDPLTGEHTPVPEDFVFSLDSLRTRFFGTLVRPSAPGGVEEPSELNNEVVVSTLFSIVETRMAQRLTTFVEAVFPTEAERNAFAVIAEKHGMPVEVLFFGADVSLEDLLARNEAREAKVPPMVVKKFFDRMVYKSRVPFRHIAEPGAVVVDRRNLSKDIALDVVCDLHGMLEPLLAMLNKLGYQLSPSGIPEHPENRSLLFIGDMVDRGPDSVGVLKLVRAAVLSGKHYAVLGNHENKLLSFLRILGTRPVNPAWSKANAKTGLEIRRLPEKEQKELISFLESLPGYYTQGRTVFAHADIGQQFRPMRMPLNACCYGASTLKAPADSDALFDMCNSEYLLVRGHVRATSAPSASRRVAVVYDDGEYGGNVTVLRLPKGGVQSAAELQELSAAQVKLASHFDYSVERNSPEAQLERQLLSLASRKLVTQALEETSGLALYKYAKSVFYDNLWSTDPALLRARGIVFDIAGQLVQNPFTKVFNHLEQGTDLPHDQTIVAATKLNGYLACVSLHPLDISRLLVTTTGSFDSDFVKMAEELISEHRARGPLMRVLRTSPERLTLMFEVVHEKDPHIVGYSKEERGLYLIGARANRLDAFEWPEDKLDALARDLGSCVKRGAWEITTFGDILQRAGAQGLPNIEGWMIRENTPEQKTLMKKKSSWYLTTKFLGRMSDSKAKLMFRNTPVFKRQVDEEFQQLVDRIVASVGETEYLALPNTERVKMVAEQLQMLG